MCRHATTELSPQPESAGAARRFVGARLAEWDLLPLLDDAQLAISELVTNAVRHGAPPLSASVSCQDDMVELAVFDGAGALPTLRATRFDLAADLDEASRAEALLDGDVDERDPRLDVGEAGTVAGGRGLLLVAALAAQWGVSPRSDGKAVWVRTPAPPGWHPPFPCPCETSPDASPLASGGRALDVG